MYMHPDFLLHRFPERKRYHFEDKILVNLKDLKQTVNLEFDDKHSLKVAIKESYGLNVKMALKQGSKYLGKSTKAGQNEILYVKNVLASKGAEKGKF
jgi:hypothetical protein